jgi:hypothetical protein
MTLYNVLGHIENHSNLTEFWPEPVFALALKFADDIEDGYWVTEVDDLRRLQSQDAPLSYTFAGLSLLGIGEAGGAYRPDR